MGLLPRPTYRSLRQDLDLGATALSTVGVKTPSFATTTLDARVLRHDEVYGLSTLYSGDGELRVPLVAVHSGVKRRSARETSRSRSPAPWTCRSPIASRARSLPSSRSRSPYVCVTFDLGTTRLDSLVTTRVSRASGTGNRASRLGNDQDRRNREGRSSARSPS
jgi:hypothetical protein